MTGTGPVGVGIIGAGMISDSYLENLTRFPDVRVIAVGDLDPARAKAQAAKYGGLRSGLSKDVLADSDIELVVNLTFPAVHAKVSSEALKAGKHVWSEKPIAVNREDASGLLDEAAQSGLRIGVAPDTILGPGMQAARGAVKRGDIGRPLAGHTIMQYPGPDIFHPNPEFLFARGAGPLFDMGPYYIAALVYILGSVDRVAAVGSTARTTRRITTGPRAGTDFDVEVPTHVAAVAQFASGAVSQSVFSFDSPLARFGIVEITGTDGTLLVPDPNTFNGEVKVTRAPDFSALYDDPVWVSIPPAGVESGRGLGVLDMARAIRTGRPHLASGELGYHVLDTLSSIDEAVSTGESLRVDSRVTEPPLLPDGFDPHERTL